MSQYKLTNVPLLDNKQIRKVFHKNAWWFSIVDFIAVLTDTENALDDWQAIKTNENDIELSTICRQLKLTAPDGKKRETDCATTEGIFRIIQSIPSPKAEPFKLWLAKIGKERIDEIENPELAMDRAKSLYEKKGYEKGWIDKRMRGVAVRHSLTDEWADRGAQKAVDFAILTNDIMQGAFDLKVQEYKKVKGS